LIIEKVKIKNYKSIRDLDLSFGQINIMIGGNGVGKSNLISFFKLLNQISNKNLLSTTIKNGGADNLLYFGRKLSSSIDATIAFRQDATLLSYYKFSLEPTTEDNFYFTREAVGFRNNAPEKVHWKSLGQGGHEGGHIESLLNSQYIKDSIVHWVSQDLQKFKVYHFHDTSESSKVKQTGDLNDNQFLREDASNLAAFLYLLREKHFTIYRQIEHTISRIAPFFQGFDLKPSALNPEKIRLEWKEKGSDLYFNAHSLSDGTLRMMCLATLLLQPAPPSTIIIDEPELGLHPAAIRLLASLIKMAAERTQVIISTQSVTLINQFTPQDIIVVDRKDGQSVFRHIDEDELTLWQEEYALGEIWEKNLIGGRP